MTNVIHIIHSKWEPRLRLSGERPPHPIPARGAKIIVLPVVRSLSRKRRAAKKVGDRITIRKPEEFAVRAPPLDMVIVSHFGGFFFAPRR